MIDNFAETGTKGQRLILRRTKTNYFFLAESVILLLSLPLGVLSSEVSFFLGILELGVVILLTILRVAKGKEITVVHLFVLFLFAYVGCFYFYFNTSLGSLVEATFSTVVVYHLDPAQQAQVNVICIIFVKILSVVFLDYRFSESSRLGKRVLVTSPAKAMVHFCLLGYLLCLTMILVTFKGSYLSLIANEEGVWFQVIAYGAIVVSPLMVLFNLQKRLRFEPMYLALALAIIIELALMGVRIYSLLFIFSLLTNLSLRGLRIGGIPTLVALAVILLFILAQSLVRMGLSSIDNNSGLFTLLGEFIFSTISVTYLVGNPFDFFSPFSFLDLLTQSLPGFIRPDPFLFDFAQHSLSYGFSPWPGGGMFLFGQLWFYFGVFGFIAIGGLARILLRASVMMERRYLSVWYALLPMLFIILPRYPLWLLRTLVFEVIVILLAVKITRFFSSVNRADISLRPPASSERVSKESSG